MYFLYILPLFGNISQLCYPVFVDLYTFYSHFIHIYFFVPFLSIWELFLKYTASYSALQITGSGTPETHEKSLKKSTLRLRFLLDFIYPFLYNFFTDCLGG